MKVIGRLLRVDEVKEYNGYKMLDFYIDASTYNQFTGDKYENVLKFKLSERYFEKLSMFNIGDTIAVTYTPKGRFYKTEKGDERHYLQLEAYTIELYGI